MDCAAGRPEAAHAEGGVCAGGSLVSLVRSDLEDDPGTDPDGWLMWAEQLHDIDLQYRPELDERDSDLSTPRCAAAQRRVTAFLMDHGRVAEFLKANDIRLTDEQMPAFLEALEVEFFASMRLLARRARRDYDPTDGPSSSRMEAPGCDEGGGD